ncbi:MAG: hypothetical protein IJ748_07940 [Bacteroidales bacterium]|nr:hypothetical protein [Bacteroidales bacterium]
MSNKLTTKNSFAFFKRNWKVLLITFVVSAIISALISLLLPNYYKSSVILLPSAVNSISKAVLNEGDKLDPYLFGTEKESEYILEMLGSGEIIGKTVSKFNLKEHYGIKGDGLVAKELVNLRLQNNIKIKRTEYLGVQLSVWDKDPKYAADIANYMVSQLTKLRHDMKQAKADSIKSCLVRTRDELRTEYLLYKDSAEAIMQESNIYDPGTYADRIAQEMAKQVAAGNNAAVERLEKKMAHLAKYGLEVSRNKDIYTARRYNWEKWDKYIALANVDLEASIPTDNVVEYATPSGLKDRPHRSIIVLLAALACTVVAMEVLVLRERKAASQNQDEHPLQA